MTILFFLSKSTNPEYNVRRRTLLSPAARPPSLRCLSACRSKVFMCRRRDPLERSPLPPPRKIDEHEQDACRGGSSVSSVAQYCNEGYEGPLCAICSPGYGTGVANSCHRCSSGIMSGMYFVVAAASLLVLALAALLAVYLVSEAVCRVFRCTRTAHVYRSLIVFEGRIFFVLVYLYR